MPIGEHAIVKMETVVVADTMEEADIMAVMSATGNTD